MKKIKYLILTLLLLIPISSKAAINCSTPGVVESGESFGVTFYGSIGGNAPIWFAKLAGEGNASYSSGDLTVAGEETSNFSRTIYYVAGDPGSARFYAYDVDVATDSDSFSDSGSCSVEIVSATKPNDGYSNPSYDYSDDDYSNVSSDVSSLLNGNNSLKSLSVDKFKITPDFNKDKTDYSLIVNGDVEKITVKAEAEEGSASVTGAGEVALKEGINKIEVVVTAENGEKKTYIISVTRKEKNPIEVIIDKKKYTVLKQEGSLKAPADFKKKTIKIDNQEVVAYTNDSTGYTIVALVDQDGKSSWFIYNEKNGTYSKYIEFTSKGLKLILLEANSKDVPYNYKKIKFKYNDEEVVGYALEYKSDYRLVYAFNTETKEKAFYLYDSKENTFQRFYNVQVEVYRDLVKKLKVAGIALISIILILLIIIVCQFLLKRKIKKFIANPKEEDNSLDLYKEELEEDKREQELKEAKKGEKKKKEEKKEFNKTMTVKLEEEYQEQELSKKELKQKKKEEKRMLKEESKKFLE